jgi:hypothetical protein
MHEKLLCKKLISNKDGNIVLPPPENIRHISLVKSQHLLSLTKFMQKKNENLEY